MFAHWTGLLFFKPFFDALGVEHMCTWQPIYLLLAAKIGVADRTKLTKYFLPFQFIYFLKLVCSESFWNGTYLFLELKKLFIGHIVNVYL